MKRNLLLLFVFYSLVTFSCVEDANIVLTGANSSIYFYCEFEQGDDVSFKYSTTTGLADKLQAINPTLTSELDISWKANGTEFDPTFRYNVSTSTFDAPRVSFPTDENTLYSLKSSLVDFPELPEIFSNTLVRTALPFSNLETVDLVRTGSEEGITIDLEFQFAVDPSNPFYELVAFTKSVVGGRVVEKHLPIETVEVQYGVINLHHRKSILIDSKKNKGQFVVALLAADLTESEIAANDHIFVKLRSVSSEHSAYHLNVAKRYEAEIAPLSEPVIAYSNIENGLGLFSGYSASLDSISIE